MIAIAYPQQPFRIKTENGREYIFDACRKRWVALTPEEWVRQNMLQYLVITLGYPASLLAVEREIALGDVRKRFDIVVYRDARPWMVIECKEMDVPVNEAVLRQVLNYNIALEVDFLVVTNGRQTFAAALTGGQHQWLSALPAY